MATAIITQSKNKETFLKTKKDYKSSFALTKRTEALLQNAVGELVKIMSNPEASNKDRLAAIDLLFKIDTETKDARNRDQIERLKLELEHLEELAMQQDATLGFEEPDEEDDEEDGNLAAVDFSKIVEIT